MAILQSQFLPQTAFTSSSSLASCCLRREIRPVTLSKYIGKSLLFIKCRNRYFCFAQDAFADCFECAAHGQFVLQANQENPSPVFLLISFSCKWFAPDQVPVQQSLPVPPHHETGISAPKWPAYTLTGCTKALPLRYHLKLDPYDGSVYGFRDGIRSMLKHIEWDGQSFLQGKRRAQSGTYPWPTGQPGSVVELNEREFAYLLSKSIVPFKEEKRCRFHSIIRRQVLLYFALIWV